MNIADRIHTLRRSKNLTLKDVHEKLKSKFGKKGALSIPYLSEIERDRSTPSISSLGKLAFVYDIPISQLISGVEFEKEDLKTRLTKLPDKTRKAFQDLLNLVKKIEGVNLDEQWISTLLRIEYRGKQPESKEGWFDIYMTLKKNLDDTPPCMG